VPAESPLAAAAAGELLFAHAAAADETALRAALAATELSGVPFADRLLYGAWADYLADGSVPTSLPAAAFTTAATALEALLRVQEYESFEALAKIGEAIAVPRDDWNEVLAQMYLRRGYLDSAAEQWIAAANERPTARAFVGLAQVALARSLDEDAAVFANHALELDPSTEQARRVLNALDVRAAA
jgi:tetratricopeptide (TPR) repeat protein